MLTCKDATLELERMKFEKASMYKKFSVGMHVLMCRACSNYKKDSVAIDKLLKENITKEDKFTDDELNSMINKIA